MNKNPLPKLEQGEEIIWQGQPASPLPSHKAAANLVVTLASAFGFTALWLMLPGLQVVRAGLLIPIVLLLLMAAYTLRTSRIQIRRFLATTYTLTNRRALAQQHDQSLEFPLGPDTLHHLNASPYAHATLTLWNTTGERSPEPLQFQQLEDGEPPMQALQALLGTKEAKTNAP